MIGDGLSHVGFGALAIGAAMNVTPLYIALPVVVISAFALLKITSNSKISGDSAIAIISSSALAIGITVCSLTGMNNDLNSYLFGSILATGKRDAVYAIVLSVIIIVTFIIFYNQIFAVTFDENFAKATGVNTSLYNMIIAVLTALTIVIGMRIMGTLLISALIIFPSLTSMRLFKNFKGVIISSIIISLFCFVTGMFISFGFDTPTGATVVLTNLGMFIVFWIISKILKR
jgi:zinc transport system permease protein